MTVNGENTDSFLPKSSDKSAHFRDCYSTLYWKFITQEKESKLDSKKYKVQPYL